MSTNTIITSAGLDYVMNTNTSGPLIAIKYCIPVYDYRLDSNIRNMGTVSAIPYSATTADTSASSFPIGERIWWTSGASDYTLSQHYIKSPFTPLVQTSIGIGANLYKGVPLSDSISAASFTQPVDDSGTWGASISTPVTGVNPTNLSPVDRSLFWPVGDYFPVTVSGNTMGGFKAHLSKAVGRFKFNKVAFYAVRMNGYEEDMTSDPVFFAEAFVKEVAVKSNIASEGFDDFVVDAEIDFSTINAYGISAFAMTSGNDFQKGIGGLYSPDPIGVGNFHGSTHAISAALQVRYTPNNSTLLRLDASGVDGDTIYHTFDVGEAGSLYISANDAFGTVVIGEDLNVKNIDAITSNTYDIGSNKRFRNIYGKHLNSDDIMTMNISATQTISAGGNITTLSGVYSDSVITNSIEAMTIEPANSSLYATIGYTTPFQTINAGDINTTNLGASNEILTDNIGPYTDTYTSGIVNINGSVYINVPPAQTSGGLYFMSPSGNHIYTDTDVNGVWINDFVNIAGQGTSSDQGMIVTGRSDFNGNISATGDITAQSYDGFTISRNSYVANLNITSGPAHAGLKKTTSIYVKSITDNVIYGGSSVSIVTVSFTGTSGYAWGDGTFVLEGTPLSAYSPATEVTVPCMVINEGNHSSGAITISSSGSVSFKIATNTTPITFSPALFGAASTIAGFESFTIHYPIF